MNKRIETPMVVLINVNFPGNLQPMDSNMVSMHFHICNALKGAINDYAPQLRTNQLLQLRNDLSKEDILQSTSILVNFFLTF